MKKCPFCELIEDNDNRIEWSSSEWVVFQPIGPVNEGHRLIVPVRHVERFEDLLTYEHISLPELVGIVAFKSGANDYNLGVNAGPAAGQTVFHLHIHFIPRYPSDIPDPRGGIVEPMGRRLLPQCRKPQLHHCYDGPVNGGSSNG